MLSQRLKNSTVKKWNNIDVSTLNHSKERKKNDYLRKGLGGRRDTPGAGWLPEFSPTTTSSKQTSDQLKTFSLKEPSLNLFKVSRFVRLKLSVKGNFL